MTCHYNDISCLKYCDMTIFFLLSVHLLHLFKKDLSPVFLDTRNYLGTIFVIFYNRDKNPFLYINAVL